MITGRPSHFGSECAIYRVLRDHGPMEAKEIAVRAHRAIGTTMEAIRHLHRCGLIHIHAWRPVTICGGHPAKVWAFGHGQDKPKPSPKDVKEVRRASWNRRRQQIKDQYGPHVAHMIFTARRSGGADRVVIDGRVVYERQHKPGQRKTGTTP